MREMISGLWAALPTPLDADGHVDHPALVAHGLWLIARGCDGLVPFGTTGEGPSFSASERLDATEALLKAGVPAERIALGTGCPAIPETVELTRLAMGLGLTHALVLPPYFFRDAPEAGIEDAFAAIIDGVRSDRLRMTLYHIPQVSGVAIPPAVLGRLRQRYGAVVAGVKDSSGDFDGFLAFRSAAPDCGGLVGAEVHIARALAAGGVGTICGMVNLVPDLVRAMFDGPAGEAAMQAACGLFAGAAFLPLMKAAMAARSGASGWRAVRPPLRAAHPVDGARVAAALAAMRTPQPA